MTYRSFLVLLDQGPQRAARSQAAIRLAKALDCHLVGVAPIGVSMPVTGEATESHSRVAPLGQGSLHVVLHSARPTLILPYAGRFDTIGTNVMVA